MNDSNLSALIWSVADLLRGDYSPAEYGKVILPFTVLRRMDCVLAPTKEAVLAEKLKREGDNLNPLPFMLKIAGESFVNTSPLDFSKLVGDQDNIAENLRSYIQAFTAEVRDIFESFEFHNTIERLRKANLLYLVTKKFAETDLHPRRVTNAQMGTIFEELIRKFAEASNATAGDHFTPREVIRLMVNLLFIEDDDALSKPGVVRSIYDPTAGTGGMLSVAEEHLHSLNPNARLVMHGQELNPESYAICKADMLIKGQDIKNIIFGNTLSADGLPHQRFDYMLSNPPFGVEWHKVKDLVTKEHTDKGYDGRFGPGLPRVSDGSLLFLMHLVSKMRPAKDGGSRVAIVLNGSPLFTGGAGSGESEIRRYMLENDLVEAIIGLPTDMFYNTGISTYIWVITNRKPQHRKGKVQLIDASTFFQKMKKSLGSKRKELGQEHIDDITRIFGASEDLTRDGMPISRIFKNADFGYRAVTVERPERDAAGKVVVSTKGKTKGKPLADSKLRDTESIPLSEDVEAYIKREVLPHAPDAWIDDEKTKVGFEISFNRFFHVVRKPRHLERIDADVKDSADRIIKMLESLDDRRQRFRSAINDSVSSKAMKDSGLDWLGDIPIDWPVLPIRRIARLESGHTPSRSKPEYWEDCKHPWFTLGDVWQIREGRKYITETTEKISDLGLANSAARLLPAGTVMLSRTASVGFSAIMGVEMATTQDFANWVCGPRILPEFLLAFFQAMTSEFNRLKYGSTHNTIYMPDLEAMRIALPSIDEQRSIVAFLESEAGQIDEIIAEASKTVRLLAERRTAFIASAVAGRANSRV